MTSQIEILTLIFFFFFFFFFFQFFESVARFQKKTNKILELVTK